MGSVLVLVARVTALRTDISIRQHHTRKDLWVVLLGGEHLVSDKGRLRRFSTAKIASRAAYAALNELLKKQVKLALKLNSGLNLDTPLLAADTVESTGEPL